MIRPATAVSLLSLVAACTTMDGGSPAGNGLAGSTWRLSELRSNEDRIGIVRPEDPSKYEMRLGTDGRAAFRLDCNRATGGWKSDTANQIRFTPLAMTRAMCPQGSLDTRIAREIDQMRSYVLTGDRLTLSMMADEGNQLWVRASD